MINSSVESVPTKGLRYDCGYITAEGDSLQTLAIEWKLSYWQDLCLYNDNLEQVCTEGCLVNGQCDLLPNNVLIHIPSVVENYFPNCTLYSDLAGSGPGDDQDTEDQSTDDPDWQRLFYLICVVEAFTILALVVLVVIVVWLATRTKRTTINSFDEEN